MIDIQDIRIDDASFQIGAARSGAITSHLLLDTINDMAKEVERKARQIAPRGKGFNRDDRPGTLKREGILREDAHFAEMPSGDFGLPGSIVTDSPAFVSKGELPGSSLSVRGPGGRFVSATSFHGPGHVFREGSVLGGRRIVSAMVTLNPLVPHARWVHEGTGIYGPRRSPIVPRVAQYLVFRWHGRRFEKKSVRGQQPQPFLTEAYVYVNNIYAPAKVSELRAELSAGL